MEIPFPNFGNGNETLLFPGMIGNGNGNGNGIVKLSEHFPHFLMCQLSSLLLSSFFNIDLLWRFSSYKGFFIPYVGVVGGSDTTYRGSKIS